jgi:DNA-binding Xre family transcriptional regulator
MLEILRGGSMLGAMSPLTVRWTVADILDRRGMSTADFADKARLTYNQALTIRRGATSRVDLETIARICEALDVKPGDLFAVEDVAAK